MNIDDFRERVVRSREDTEEALKIIKSFEPLIKKCIKIYVKDPESFEDAMQEGRIAIFKCIYRYDVTSPIHFPGYAKMAVIYCIKGFGSKHKENISLDGEINDDGGTLYDIMDSGMDVEGDEIKREEINFLKSALLKLPQKERKIIEEVYFEGKSMAEICRGRRCHYMTVVRNKKKALDSLRKMIER
jgi:RNA polymerase sporulation-specific sigma factor